MHATAFSPVLIDTVLGAIKKQMCFRRTALGCGLEVWWTDPRPVFDIANEQTEEGCEHCDEVTEQCYQQT